MNWIKILLNRHKCVRRNLSFDFPARDEIIQMMFDKDLDSWNGEVQNVIYSIDKTKRFVILKNKNVYKYTFQEIHFFDYDEYAWFCADSLEPNKVMPAYWESEDTAGAYSFFGTLEETMKNMCLDPNYITYFVE